MHHDGQKNAGFLNEQSAYIREKCLISDLMMADFFLQSVFTVFKSHTIKLINQSTDQPIN